MPVQAEPDIRAELLERLRFETLLADISARFVNVPAAQVDHEIEDAQRAICECLEVEHSSLWQASADPATLLLTHLYRDPGLPPPFERMSGSEFFPWVVKKLQAKEIVCLADTDNAPMEAAQDMKAWRHFKIKSTLAIPLALGDGPVIGVLSFDATQRKRHWPDLLQRRLQVMAQVFANALDRKHTEEKLRESEARLTLAANAANAGLWTLDTATGEIWATQKMLELLGAPTDKELDYEMFLGLVHPQDREQVVRVINGALQSGQESHVQFRVPLPDGGVRWLGARGRRHSRRNGEPHILMGITMDITDIRNARQERTAFAGQLLNAQEAESARLARELHDDLGQAIALFALQLHKATVQVQSISPGAEAPLQELRKKIGLIARRVSTLSHQLHSSELEFLGLAAAAKGLCRELSEQHAVEIRCSCEPLPEGLEREVALCLFRVLQEALNNFIKHSKGKKAEVLLRADLRSIQLTVSDDGMGFEPKKPVARLGLGLISMAERMRLVDGELSIRSKPGAGTAVEARAPLRAANGHPEH